MNTFEQAIRAQQEEDKYTQIRWPHQTIGHLIRAVMDIHTAEDAKSFRDGYIEWLRIQPDLKESPESVADANIGWCFGEGMPESDRKIWRSLGARHPILPI